MLERHSDEVVGTKNVVSMTTAIERLILMIRVGYMRVSTKEQELSLEEQRHQLMTYGVAEDRIFIDRGVSGKANGTSQTMLELFAVVEGTTEEVEVVVTKLDRWGRNPMEIEHGVKRLSDAGGSFTALAEGITRANDRNTVGMLLIRILGAIAAMERERIAERTRDSLQALRRRGVPLGAPPKLSSKDVEWIKQMHAEGWGALKISKAIESERNVKVSKGTVMRVLGMGAATPYVPKDNHKYVKRVEDRQARSTV